MTQPPHPSDPNEPDAPPPPVLGAAQQHLAAAENALQHNDFDGAVRERYRAVVRGLEQGGILEVQRGRTARETADSAAAAVPEAAELPPVAANFNEIVYGGRAATPDEYWNLARADHYSQNPPPPPGPTDTQARPRRSRNWRLPPLPELVRRPQFWAAVAGVLILAAIVYLLWHLALAPTAPPAEHLPAPDQPPNPPNPPQAGPGQDSVFDRLPHWLAYGGLQFLIAFVIVVWWRARRRGALVGEPRPVEVAANEVLTGQAALYRRSKDFGHIAGQLRAATLRRIRPGLRLTADAPPDRVITTISTQLRVDPQLVGAALFGPVPDSAALELVATQLEWIESEIT